MLVLLLMLAFVLWIAGLIFRILWPIVRCIVFPILGLVVMVYLIGLAFSVALPLALVGGVALALMAN